MAISSIAILGGDLRQCYCAEYLLSLGWQATCFHTLDFPYHGKIRLAKSLAEALADAKVVLAPTPLSKDNALLYQSGSQHPSCPLAEIWDSMSPGQILAVHSIREQTARLLAEKNCPVFQFSQSETFTAGNSRLTAEGLLSEIIRLTPFSLASANVLLLGYGRCGSAIGNLLHPLCRTAYVVEWDLSHRAQAEKNGLTPVAAADFPEALPPCSLVINTIPAPVLEPGQLQRVPGSCHIFDIASAPFGFPADTTEKYLLPYFRIPGIPGRFAPADAGQLIGKTIERISDYGL